MLESTKEILSISIGAIAPAVSVAMAYLIKYIFNKKNAEKNSDELNKMVNDIIDAEITLGAKQGRAKFSYVLENQAKKNKKTKLKINEVVNILKTAKNKVAEDKKGV